MEKKTYKEAKSFRNNSGFIALLSWMTFALLHRPPESDFTVIGIFATVTSVMFIVFCSIVSYYKTTNKINKNE